MFVCVVSAIRHCSTSTLLFKCSDSYYGHSTLLDLRGPLQRSSVRPVPAYAVDSQKLALRLWGQRSCNCKHAFG